MKKSSWSYSFFLILMLLGYNSVMAANQDAPTIKLQFDTESQSLDVLLINDHTKDLSVYNSLDLSGSGVPKFVWVRVETEDGRILSNGEISQEGGYISSNIFVSDLMVTPVPLTLIAPGQALSVSVKLEKLLAGLDRYLPNVLNNLNGKCVAFKVRIYLNEGLTYFFEQESLPVCFAGQKTK